MTNSYVGAGILNIITESLYDNPIVVFREYVQNSVDSILKEENPDSYRIKIWCEGDNLCFLDNAAGIDTELFHTEMISIGNSAKKRSANLGYKGIGRLSGVPYAKRLTFINIVDYKNRIVQSFSIDGAKYEKIKENGDDRGITFAEIMNQIGSYEDSFTIKSTHNYYSYFLKYKELFNKTNTGFLVILEKISPVLKNTIEDDNFFTNLQWLLPVDFDSDVYTCEKNELFREIKEKNCKDFPIPCCNIAFNDKQILRPIRKGMFRDYLCKNDFKYAFGFHSFYRNKIAIDRNNLFTGIRIYIDNMLLCTEDELLRNLDNYGLLKHTLNGQLQSVRGIGAMIYIYDKINIAANARRTFIEVTDNDSLDFLKLIAEFVNTIYDTRYSLSNYINAKAKLDHNSEQIKILREVALNNLRKLAKETIELPPEDNQQFSDLSMLEKKRAIKKILSHKIDVCLKAYMETLDDFNEEIIFDRFVEWLTKNTM